jgi:LysE type translocator
VLPARVRPRGQPDRDHARGGHGARDAEVVARGKASGSRNRGRRQPRVAVWVPAAALGVAAIVRASQALFDFVRLAGAVYLVLVGIRPLRRRARPPLRPSIQRLPNSPLDRARLSGRRDDESPQSEDGRVLHQSVAAVRRSDGRSAARAARARSGLQRVGTALAQRVRAGPSHVRGRRWQDLASVGFRNGSRAAPWSVSVYAWPSSAADGGPVARST